MRVNETPAGEMVATTIASGELGLAKGSLAELDACVAKLPREQLALRLVGVLTGFAADHGAHGRNVNVTFAKALAGSERCSRLSRALEKRNAIFIEPLQQLVMLRRCLTVGGNGDCDVWSDAGLAAYFDACRYAADVCRADTGR